jgi:hypothetical protein
MDVCQNNPRCVYSHVKERRWAVVFKSCLLSWTFVMLSLRSNDGFIGAQSGALQIWTALGLTNNAWIQMRLSTQVYNVPGVRQKRGVFEYGRPAPSSKLLRKLDFCPLPTSRPPYHLT